MSITVIWDWANSASVNSTSTIEDLQKLSQHYRHPDSARVAYPHTVQAPLGKLPEGTHRVAIVGAGAAGICAFYELSQLAKGLPDGSKIVVDLYDNDPDHFLAPSPNKDIDTQNRRAGRVSAARVSTSDTERTVYEVGAMRFPEIAGLTWHYASKAFNPTETVKVFPNPGKVPTEFVFGNRVDRYKDEDWLDSDSPTRRVQQLVFKYFPGSLKNDSSLFKIGKRDPAAVATLLKAESTDGDTLDGIYKDWQAFIAEHDHTTLAGAIRKIMTHVSDNPGEEDEDRLPDIPGLDAQGTIDYCVELFGRFGFGTGGFKPLYNISLVEMMRLVLWNYSNEYTLPVEENVEFIKKLHEKAMSEGAGKLVANFINGRVSDAYHFMPADSSSARKAKLWHYTNTSSELREKDYDYVLLAMPQDQLTPLIRRSGYSPSGIENTQVGDARLQLGTDTATQVYPALQLSRSDTAPTERIVSAINQLHMTRSSKVFGLISQADSSNGSVPTFRGAPIQAVVSDSGLAASYIVPSSIAGQEYSSFLASYTWEDDSTRLQQDYARYPQNSSGDEGPQSAWYMFQTMINRVDHDVQDPAAEPGTYKRWWFGALLDKVQNDNRFVYDWTTNRSAGGFKLDMTGDHHLSNLCFRYHTHSANPALNNRFFLACDSYSHLGGWLEGAFMSAINAVAGVVVAANGGNVMKLDPKAQPLFDTLAHIAPTR
ncbi:flavin monoamine oxidase family protein [Pseudomonas chlororaphis]|uniref:tryptophan 2-monooxygenase oxidoreductase n=1 Tax=Pseudomonas chlororaphis TaxID=587753 RepID=UPI000D1045AF|nr:tryptophan 2-monooxygenase oxidoreductase [Pseudomonas chlororaphis]AVO60225.1 tryptophan 2-monooxygenase oxidoreductase [Pseudomonas chlororaphis subsp. piscium]